MSNEFKKLFFILDRASRTEEPPWKESEDAILEAFCRTGEDLLLTIDLRFDSTDFTFEM